jgi:UDP-3-O-[3-hydroxymyristoyl] glucosamine N-acyltransferase
MNRSDTGYPLAELAERFALELRGDGTLTISGVGTLAAATPAQLSFLANPRYRGELRACRAGAVVLRADDAAIVQARH